MKKHLGFRLGYRLRRFLGMALLSGGLAMGGCGSPDLVSPYIPLPPPDANFTPGTAEVDSAGVSHTYWKVTSPAASQMSNIWVYIDNIELGVGVSLRASLDGSYSTRIEGQEGDRIHFGFGVSFANSEWKRCRLLREGPATTVCQ
jgi:hypothetical protein